MKTRRILSAILAIALVLTSSVGVFGAESQNEGEYNSLKLPVINEIQPTDENGEISLMSAGASDGAYSGGAGGSSGSSVPVADNGVERVSISEQTAPKGELLRIKAEDVLNDETLTMLNEIYENNYSYDSYFVFEKDGVQTVRYERYMHVFGYYNEIPSLEIPVPAELENGKYSVHAYQMNSSYGYRESGIETVVFELNINVTDMAGELDYPIHADEIAALGTDAVIDMHEGDYDAYGSFAFAEALPGEAKMTGFAICDDGRIVGDLYAYATSDELEIDKLGDLAAGNYKCYYKIISENGWDNPNPDVLYGPVTVNVYPIGFGDAYYNCSETDAWVNIELGASAASMLPEEEENNGGTVSIDFKDADGNLVNTMDELPLEDMWIERDDNGSARKGTLYTRLSFIGFDAGEYFAELTFNGGSGTYYLGVGKISVTDKTIINNISILNRGELTTATRDFYVKVDMSGIFTECDKIDIKLVDSYNDDSVIAETVSKTIYDIGRDSTRLLFKLNVVGTLEDSTYHYGKYSLDLRTDSSLELISAVNRVRISVSSMPTIVRAEVSEDNTITFYTENVLPGEYTVSTGYNDEKRTFSVTIDEQGKGSFVDDGYNNGYEYYNLYSLDEIFIDDFRVTYRDNRDYFDSDPQFIGVNSSGITDFYIRPLSQIDRPSAENIEYVRITQNGETIAVMNNLKNDRWSYYNEDEGSRLNLCGDVVLEPGKSFAKGEAQVEVKYTDGYVYTHAIPVTDETTGSYGSFELAGAKNFYGRINGMYFNELIPNGRASFTLKNTNAAEGSLTLCDNGNGIETINLSELNKTVKDGCYYTYTGSFNTEISADDDYTVDININGRSKIYGSFTRYNGKTACMSSDINAVNGEGDIYLYDLMNVTNKNNITFKALCGKREYNIPARIDHGEDDYVDFVADYSAMPKGYFTLKAYENGTEIMLGDSAMGYNFGSVSEPVSNGFGWRWLDDGKREFTVYGANLDMVNEAVIKLYKTVDFTEGEDYSKTRLEYVKDIAIPQPYGKTRIAIDNALLADLETDRYLMVAVLDGKSVQSQSAFIKGAAPTFRASMVINGGVDYTNKTSVPISITSSGYTKMRFAFSAEELETAAYEPIDMAKMVSLEGKSGLVTIYAQFANDDETKTEIAEGKITVDTTAPTIDNVIIPKLQLWNSGTVTFLSDEPLRNAFILIGTQMKDETVIGRNYVFAPAGTQDGKYAYKCTVYADSAYAESDKYFAQIAAYDKAGNETKTRADIMQVTLPRSISGTVTYNGNAVSDALIYLYNEDGLYEKSTYTDKDGNYSFYDIAAGNYTIASASRFYEKSVINVTEDEFGEDITGKDLVLSSVFENRSAVTVSVKDALGAPVAGAYVAAYCRDADVNIASSTNENGDAVISVPYRAGGSSYRIYVNHNDYSISKYIEIDSAAHSVEMAMPPKAIIHGTAKFGEIAAAGMELIISGNGYTTYTKTDAEGKFNAEVYLADGNREFTVYAKTAYAGSAAAVFGEGESETDITLELKEKARVKGSIKDAAARSITEFSSLTFSGDDVYVTVTPDANGEFETPNLFTEGTYGVYAYCSWPYNYKTISRNFEITEEDINSGIKELNLTAETKDKTTVFSGNGNKITADASVISKGDTVSFGVKIKNDGTAALSDVTAYAKLPEGTAVAATNGNAENGIVSKTIASMKADESASFTFTLSTDEFDGRALTVPAFVKANGKEYTIGTAVVEVASVTLSAPQVVKTGAAFKVSGEAMSASTVEILNYDTKAVLATTEPTSKWYFADVPGINEDTTVIARVSKNGKIGYSEPTLIKVDENPISVADVKVNWTLGEYGVNKYYGYPTFSMWEGYSFDISTKFNNLPDGAAVKYSFMDRKNISTTKNSEDYYRGTINNWNGYGTKKVIATVTDGEDEYEFIVAEVIILIDPSGYITDSETGEPVVGATVLLEVKSGDEWIKWDAEPHLQQNPMLTDEEGHYGWMVPEGEYRIIVNADGYESKTVETYNSRDYGDNSKITVLPVRTDVDIALVNTRAAEINPSETASVAGGRVKFVFTRPVDPTSVTADSFKVLNEDGTAVNGTIILAENNTVAIFKPTAAMANGQYKLSLSNIKDGKGNAIPAEEITFEKQADAAALAAPTVAYNSDGTVTVTFAEGKEPVNIEEIVVKNGDAVVDGTYRRAGNVITFIPDTAFAASTSYKVVISDALRTADGEYLAAAAELNFTSGGSAPVTPGGTTGGGGGGGTSVPKPTASVLPGEVAPGTKVELSTTIKNAKIYYTTDGSEPTEKSTLYTGAITINEDVVIKYIAIGDKTKSAVVTAEYKVKKSQETADKSKFADTAGYEWAVEAINALAEKGIIKGVSDTEFALADNIKRADFMLLLVRMLDLKADVSGNFDDVSADSYYYEGVGIAKALGLTDGVGGNKFNPEESISRQDMFVMAYRILQMQGVELAASDESAISAFDDYSEIAGYAREGLAALVKNELVKGSDNRINSLGSATRAETAVFVFRLCNLFNK